MSTIAEFRSLRDKGENVKMEVMFHGIKNGRWQTEVSQLRSLRKGETDFEKIKSRLPFYMISCTTSGGHKATSVERHSGLLQLDIDDVGAADAGELRDIIGKDPHILAAWISPSGTGVKAVMLIPADIQHHKAAFEAASDYMRRTYRVEIDKSCSNINRLCYVSYDPDITANKNAVELAISDRKQPLRGKRGRDSLYKLNLPLPLHNKHKFFVDFPRLEKLYRTFVEEPYGTVCCGNRNEAIIGIVTDCFQVVVPELILKFIEVFHSSRRQTFSDYPLEVALSEAKCMIRTLLYNYPLSWIKEDEALIYMRLPSDREKTVFRICRSLALCESDESVPPPWFFLSAENLSFRLGLFAPQAQRVLKYFEKLGVVKIIKKGAKHSPGAIPRATVFEWMIATQNVSDISAVYEVCLG